MGRLKQSTSVNLELDERFDLIQTLLTDIRIAIRHCEQQRQELQVLRDRTSMLLRDIYTQQNRK